MSLSELSPRVLSILGQPETEISDTRPRPKPNPLRDALHYMNEPMDTGICKNSIEEGVNDAVFAGKGRGVDPSHKVRLADS